MNSIINVTEKKLQVQYGSLRYYYVSAVTQECFRTTNDSALALSADYLSLVRCKWPSMTFRSI